MSKLIDLARRGCLLAGFRCAKQLRAGGRQALARNSRSRGPGDNAEIGLEEDGNAQMGGNSRSNRTIIVDGVPLSDVLDETMIRDVVHGFYDEIRREELLGPIFHEDTAWRVAGSSGKNV